MKTRLISILDTLRTSFWFVPTLMVLGAVILAVATLVIDDRIDDQHIEQRRWLYTGGSEAARDLLSTVASSVITVAGVVFSITIVVLSLASQQLGPRLLRTFMRDRGTQVVLGTFVATFTYSLLILRTVREIDDEAIVPHISVTVAMLLAICSLTVLIYFIHHVSMRIQAHNVLAAVSHDLDAAVETLFPRRLGQPPVDAGRHNPQIEIPPDFERRRRPVPATSSGYLQAIDNDGLMELAVKHDLLIRLNCRPGHFIARGADLLWAYPARQVDEALIRDVNSVFILASQRTLTQDVEFAIEQLVEIAVRALSSGINDPFTAIGCVDRLTAALCEIANREMPDPFRYDSSDRLRVIAYPQTFASIVDMAFNQIRQNSSNKPAVAIRVLEGVTTIARCVEAREGLDALVEQVVSLHKACQSRVTDEKDRRDIEDRYVTAMRALQAQ